MRRCSWARIQEAAVNRRPGYVQAIRDASASVSDTHVVLSSKDFDEIRQEYALPGPGTELKKLLKTIGIEAKPGCACNKRAQTMDVNGCDWCAENLDTISSWLQEEAHKRGLPYIPAAGKWIINLAIKRARRGIGQ